ncbi:ABC transporter ATP-binding protein [Halovenus salina]|uniref:ABC transporter ATP-binding protein n=1 Tax=Halovenus salina TaxID=1510225 RepID=UPI002260C64B|nr:ABC transporter ATP-binding protein [Halovenus salina]
MSERSPVHCQDVSRIYQRPGSRFVGGGEPVTALSNISLEIEQGEVIGIAGPSGSGKSTLLHLLAGLDTPTSGTVSLAGTKTDDLTAGQRTRYRLDHVGLVFQRFYLLPSLRARANVALPLIEQGVDRRRRRSRASELLELVGLEDRATHRPGALSGGEKQRVAIARALATNPSLIVADEPTGELDTETGEQVLDVLTANREQRALIIASHDERALARADRIIHLQDGERVSGSAQ